MKLLDRLPRRGRLHLALSLASLLGSLAFCVTRIVAAHASLPWHTIWIYLGLATLLRVRLVVVRRDADGSPLLVHVPGDTLFAAVILRETPDTALAVAFLSLFFSLPFCGRVFRQMKAKPVGDPVFFCVLIWVWAECYRLMGGLPVRTFLESVAIFQRPMAVLVPLLGATFVAFEAILRGYLGLFVTLRDGQTLRESLYAQSVFLFYLFETLCGVLGAALFTAYGWPVLPFVYVIHEALLLSARSHFETQDARQEAGHDPLTGLASWRGISKQLDEALTKARRSRQPVSLLFLDADGLKTVNDRFGHAAGNELLRRIGEVCRDHARAQDGVGRRGGDEFLVVLEGIGRADAERVMARIRQAVADAFAVHPEFSQANVGVSIGLAVYPEDATDAETLIEAADRQMYHDKRARKAARAA